MQRRHLCRHSDGRQRHRVLQALPGPATNLCVRPRAVRFLGSWATWSPIRRVRICVFCTGAYYCPSSHHRGPDDCSALHYDAAAHDDAAGPDYHAWPHHHPAQHYGPVADRCASQEGSQVQVGAHFRGHHCERTRAARDRLCGAASVAAAQDGFGVHCHRAGRPCVLMAAIALLLQSAQKLVWPRSPPLRGCPDPNPPRTFIEFDPASARGWRTSTSDATDCPPAWRGRGLSRTHDPPFMTRHLSPPPPSRWGRASPTPLACFARRQSCGAAAAPGLYHWPGGAAVHLEQDANFMVVR